MKREDLRRRIRDSAIAIGVLLLASGLFGQVQLGDELKFNLNGNLATDYTGSYGNQISSSHGFGFGGTAGIAGSYHDPNFLSFDIDPFYNQSRSNSTFASLTNATGVTLSS